MCEAEFDPGNQEEKIPKINDTAALVSSTAACFKDLTQAFKIGMHIATDNKLILGAIVTEQKRLHAEIVKLQNMLRNRDVTVADTTSHYANRH